MDEERYLTRWESLFYARLTGRYEVDVGTDVWAYSWVQVLPDTTSPGVFTDTAFARDGFAQTGPAFEISNAKIDIPEDDELKPIVQLRFRQAYEGLATYSFDYKSSQSTKMVEISSEFATEYGYYDAVLTEFFDGVWHNGVAVLVKASNDELLEQNKRYLVRYADVDETNKDIYTTDRFPELDPNPEYETITVVTEVCPIYEDIPSTPSGPAGGGLSGTYPNPIVVAVDGGTW